jgi:hypothetical protein
MVLSICYQSSRVIGAAAWAAKAVAGCGACGRLVWVACVAWDGGTCAVLPSVVTSHFVVSPRPLCRPAHSSSLAPA